MTASDLALKMLAVVPDGTDVGTLVGALAIGQRIALGSAVRNGANEAEYKRFVVDGVVAVLNAELPSQRAAKMN